MTIRLRRLLALGLLLTPTLAAVAAIPPAPDVTTILRSAQNRVNVYPIYYRAVLRSATGTTNSGATTNSSDLVNWLFVYDNTPTPQRTNPRIFSVSLAYHSRVFDKVTPGPVLPDTADDIIPLPLMTLTHAVQLIQKAGVTSAFTGVELIYVPSATTTHPTYIFSLVGGGTATIDIITAKITTTP